MRAVPGLALATRALRLDARSITRGGQRMAIVLVLIGSLVWSRSMGSLVGAPGEMLLGWLVFLNAVAITLLAIGAFAAVIAEEKEERTLGLLLLAGFGPLSLLAGKSAGELCTALLLLAVQLPFAFLSVTLGGVAPAQVAAAYAVLGAYLLGAYGVALLASVACARPRTAGLLTGTLLIGSWAGPPFAALLLAWAGVPAAALQPAVEGTWALTVWSGIDAALGTAVDTLRVQRVVVAHLTVAVVAAGCAALVFGRCEREEPAAAPARGGVRRRRTAGRRPPPGLAAMAWKDYRFVAGGRAGLVVRGAVYALLVVGALGVGRSSAGAAGGAPTAAMAYALAQWSFPAFALESGVLAARVFRTETQGRTLPSLALLPYPLAAIARRKAAGCARALLPGALCLGAAVAVSLTLAPFQGMALVWSVLAAHLLLGMHLAAYYSLTAARGAVPLAVVSVFGWVVCEWLLVASCAGTGSGIEVAVLFVLATLGVTAAVHARIGTRLEAAAGR